MRGPTMTGALGARPSLPDARQAAGRRIHLLSGIRIAERHAPDPEPGLRHRPLALTDFRHFAAVAAEPSWTRPETVLRLALPHPNLTLVSTCPCPAEGCPT